MRILLTGGTGFLGGHALAALRGRHEIFAVARRRGSAAVEWIEQDLTRLDPARLPARVDAVWHLAQSRHYRSIPDHAADVHAVNVDATMRLAEYARRCGARFLFASSGSVYGTGAAAFAESDLPRPRGFYACSKAAAELLIAGLQGHLDAVVLRLFYPYGPGQDDRLIPNVARKIRTGETVVLDSADGPKLNPIHVADAVRAMETLLDRPVRGTFNLAGTEVVTVRKLAELIGELAGRAPSIEAKNGPAQDCVGEIGALRDAIGFEPAVPLRDGLQALLSGG